MKWRVSRYSIWSQLWIIPYELHVPVTRETPEIGDTRLPGGHLSVPSLSTLACPPSASPLLVAVTGPDMADGHRGQDPLLRDKANRGGGHADMDMPFNSILLVHCYWGFRFILTFWGYQLFMIVLYGLLGVFGARQGRSARFDYFWPVVWEELVLTNQEPPSAPLANGETGHRDGLLIISLIQYLTLTGHRPSRAQHKLDLNCLQTSKDETKNWKIRESRQMRCSP